MNELPPPPQQQQQQQRKKGVPRIPAWVVPAAGERMPLCPSAWRRGSADDDDYNYGGGRSGSDGNLCSYRNGYSDCMHGFNPRSLQPPTVPLLSPAGALGRFSRSRLGTGAAARQQSSSLSHSHWRGIRYKFSFSQVATPKTKTNTHLRNERICCTALIKLATTTTSTTTTTPPRM